MKLNEGEVHTFFILKKVQIPDEGEFFMLRHQSGRRLLLPNETYKNFGIEVGNSIECRIDKVSCSGKVYLEPTHPVYKEGVEYNFDLVRVEKQDNRAVIQVRDCFGNVVTVFSSQEYQSKEGEKSIYLKVDRVKKGVPILSIPDQSNNLGFESTYIGKKELFLVKNIAKNIDNEDVYVLLSPEGLVAELKYKHFKSYGFKLGESIQCEVYGLAHTGLLKVEPQNPFYQIGEVYVFQVVKSIQTQYSDQGDDTTIMVTDELGNRCGVSVNPEVFQKFNEKTQLECRVKGFRKGRPRLELV